MSRAKLSQLNQLNDNLGNVLPVVCSVQGVALQESPGEDQIQPELPLDIEGSFRRWEPASGPGKSYGALFLSISLAWVVLASVFAFMSDGSLRILFGLIALTGIGAFAILTVLIARLRSIGYVLDAEDMIIEWSGHQIDIRYTDISSVVFEDGSNPQISGYERYWPGFHLSSGRVADEDWRTVATLPPDRRIRIYTYRGVIAISPEHPVLFLQELAARRQRAADLNESEPDLSTRPSAEMVDTNRLAIDGEREPLSLNSPQPAERPAGWFASISHVFHQNLLGDPIASNLLAAGVIMIVLMTVYSVWRIDGSFAGGPIHWNARGEPDVFISARGGWIFVLIAGTVLIINTALAMLCTLWDQFVSRLLLASTIAVQVLLALALLRSIN